MEQTEVQKQIKWNDYSQKKYREKHLSDPSMNNRVKTLVIRRTISQLYQEQITSKIKNKPIDYSVAKIFGL